MIASEILARYQAGDSIKTIQHNYHLGHTAIRHILTSMGATIRPKGQTIRRPGGSKPPLPSSYHPIPTDSDAAREILARYQAGDNMQDISREYHTSRKIVRRLLIAQGATIRKPGGPCASHARAFAQRDTAALLCGHHSDTDHEILVRYQDGDSLHTLRRDYHLGLPKLRRLLVAMGATIRPTGQHGRPCDYRNPSFAQQDIQDHTGDPQYCKRCEILLRFDPGHDGYCSECFLDLHPQGAQLACHWLQRYPTQWRTTPAHREYPQ